YTYSECLELDHQKSNIDSTTKLTIEEIVSKEQNVPMYAVHLSFNAADNVEALRKVDVNSAQSLLVFKGGLELVSYHIELVEKRWLSKKIIEDQFYMYKSLSA
ncbi:MAG: hypothetical protein N4A59_08035, partial [Marinifilum sp.]|nr:hypothetical protein [Marinifilum sp.]